MSRPILKIGWLIALFEKRQLFKQEKRKDALHINLIHSVSFFRFLCNGYRKGVLITMAKKKQNPSKFSDKCTDNGNWVRCKKYINRWGQEMVAADYGYPYWCFLIK